MTPCYSVVIIGSGFAGLTYAIKLKERGIDNIQILERESSLGGTWQNNQYPGAAVDVESKLYSLSFEPYPWTQRYAPQAEILAYTKNIIKKHRLDTLAQTNADVRALTFNEATQLWQIQCNDGRTFYSRAIICAIGYLSQPKQPAIDGLETFSGQIMHTGQWDHDIELTNKTVALIGTGASAIQVAPKIADKVKHLHVYQRTPNWIVPRNNRSFNQLELTLQRYAPTRQFMRLMKYIQLETRLVGFRYLPVMIRLIAETQARLHLRKQVKNNALRQTLTPNYQIGCKRILISDDYYPCLQKSTVTLNTNAIASIDTSGITDINGQHTNVDAIILATGFHAFANEQCLPFSVTGRNQQTLLDVWKDTPQAHLGVMVPGFPNLFFATGPNTSIGHTSAIYMIESQIGYIMSALTMLEQNAKVSQIEVTKAAYQEYNASLRHASQRSVWEHNCMSWYQNKHGVNTSIYPGFTFVFRYHANRFDSQKHAFS